MPSPQPSGVGCFPETIRRSALVSLRGDSDPGCVSLFLAGFVSALVLVWGGRALARRPLLFATLAALLGWYWPLLEAGSEAWLGALDRELKGTSAP